MAYFTFTLLLVELLIIGAINGAATNRRPISSSSEINLKHGFINLGSPASQIIPYPEDEDNYSYEYSYYEPQLRDIVEEITDNEDPEDKIIPEDDVVLDPKLGEQLSTLYNWKLETANNPPSSKYGFWSVHPSHLSSPFRRPSGGQYKRLAFGIGRRNNDALQQKKSADNPYHPIPRSVAIKNKQTEDQAHNQSLLEDEESAVQKRQSPGSYLLFKLSRLNRVPPTTPDKNTSNRNESTGKDSNRST